MSFKSDVRNTAGLRGAYKPGLQALRQVDRSRLTAKPARKLAGSVDLDTALAASAPRDSRWDYVVAWTRSNGECLHWVEIHDADRAGAPAEVCRKLQWLRAWLESDGRRLEEYPRRFVWVASGRSAFQQNSPQLKRLALAGMHFAGGHYTLSD